MKTKEFILSLFKKGLNGLNTVTYKIKIYDLIKNFVKLA